MTGTTNINEVLDSHVTLEVECVDRMLLNAFVKGPDRSRWDDRKIDHVGLYMSKRRRPRAGSGWWPSSLLRSFSGVQRPEPVSDPGGVVRFHQVIETGRGWVDHAWAVYRWNIELAAAFTPLTCDVEVTLRNTIHDRLATHLGRPD